MACESVSLPRVVGWSRETISVGRSSESSPCSKRIAFTGEKRKSGGVDSIVVYPMLSDAVKVSLCTPASYGSPKKLRTIFSSETMRAPVHRVSRSPILPSAVPTPPHRSTPLRTENVRELTNNEIARHDADIVTAGPRIRLRVDRTPRNQLGAGVCCANRNNRNE